MPLKKLKICAADWLVRRETLQPINDIRVISAQPIRMRTEENIVVWDRTCVNLTGVGFSVVCRRMKPEWIIYSRD